MTGETPMPNRSLMAWHRLILVMPRLGRSPDAGTCADSTERTPRLRFPVLSDVDGAIAPQLGTVYRVSDPMPLVIQENGVGSGRAMARRGGFCRCPRRS